MKRVNFILIGVLILNLFFANITFAKTDNLSYYIEWVKEYFLSEPYEYQSSISDSCVGYNARVIECNGNIYCFGSDATLIYNVSLDTWDTASAMPIKRSDYGIAATNGEIYIIGGLDDNSQPTKRVDVFDTNKKFWRTAADLQYSIYGFDAVAVNDIIYCAGGYSEDSFNENMQYLDVSSGIWANGKNIPKVGEYTAVAQNNLIYYTMSKLNSGNITLIYNTLNNKWTFGQSRPYYNIDNVQVDNGKLLNLSNYFLLYINTDSQSSENCHIKYAYLPNKNVWAVLPDIFSVELQRDKIISYDNRIFSFEEQIQNNGMKKSVFRILYLYNNRELYTDNSVIAVGDRHILAVKDGVLMAKGNNDYGQLGDGTTNESDVFIKVNSPWESNGETIRMIAAGANSSYVITDKCNLYAWGINTSGALGNGSNKNVTVPELVETNVVSVAAGKLHTAIIKRDASIWTSGNNLYGQLGSSAGSNSKFRKILGINDAKMVECGDYQTFFIDKNKALYSCGKNNLGQLGIGSDAEYVSKFSQVASGIISVSSGYNHTLALSDDRNVYSWGSNTYKQLGTSEVEKRNTPGLINGISDVDEIKAGGNTSIYLKDGDVYKWGRSINSTDTPNKVNRVSNIYDIDAGDIIVAVDENNNMWQWGFATYNQELFDTDKTRNPVKIQSLHSSYNNIEIRDIAARRNQVLAVDGNMLFAWGSGYFSTGKDSEETYGYFKEIEGSGIDISELNHISRGKNFNAIINRDGSLYAWGSNTNSPMGDQGGKVKTASVVPNFNAKVLEDEDRHLWESNNSELVAAGDGFMVVYVNDIETNGGAMFKTGKLYTIGANSVGQLGNGEFGGSSNIRNEIIKIEFGRMNVDLGFYSLAVNEPVHISALAAGDDFATAIQGNKVYVWGGNQYGQLGLGHTNNVCTPTIIPTENIFTGDSTEEHFIDIKAGPDFCIGLTSAGNVYSWGKNTAGQLGLGHKNNVYTPTKITNLSNVKSIGVGYNHAMAIKEDGTLWTWGYSSEQLGRDKNNAASPKQVLGLPEMAGVSGGYGFTVAYDVDGNLWTFGSNDKGALCIYTDEPCNIHK